MEKALVFNGGTNCTSHSNGIWTDGKSSNTYIRKIKSLISSGACKEKKKRVKYEDGWDSSDNS